MDNIEKIADELIELFGRHQRAGITLTDLDSWHQGLWRNRAKQILHALLSDPDTHIIEYDPDAELPVIAPAVKGSAIGHIKKQAYQEMVDDGWVKPK